MIDQLGLTKNAYPGIYFVPRNTTKLTTRGGTSPNGVEMTLIRKRKSIHRRGYLLPPSCVHVLRRAAVSVISASLWYLMKFGNFLAQ